MKLLEKGQENDSLVTWEDQSNINQFSKLNVRLERMDDLYSRKKTELEYLEDLEMELELGEDEVPYKIGDSFVLMSLEQVQERIEKEQQALKTELKDYSNEISEIGKEMDRLKALLYGKFGNNINLEK